jgi:hypothetical protein
MKPRASPAFTLSSHARRRIDSRGISLRSVDAAIRWGRASWSHGDRLFFLDRRSVHHARREGVRVDEHEGTVVILTTDGTVRTVFRNRSLKRVWR